jgi:transposase
MGKQAGARRSEALKKRRLKAARLFDEGATQADVARRLGVSRVSAMRWYQAWRKNGRDGLGQVRPLGRRSRLSPQELERVEAALLEGPQAHGYSTDLWTLPRVAVVVERVSGVRYHPGHVWRVLRGLGWSLQRPTLRARERDDEAVANWKRVAWRRAKKTPAPTEP